MVQFEPAATEAPQLLDWLKSLGFEPETLTLVTLRSALPVLVRVMVCTGLAVLRGNSPRARLEGETLAMVVAMDPERATD